MTTQWEVKNLRPNSVHYGGISHSRASHFDMKAEIPFLRRTQPQRKFWGFSRYSRAQTRQLHLWGALVCLFLKGASYYISFSFLLFMGKIMSSVCLESKVLWKSPAASFNTKWKITSSPILAFQGRWNGTQPFLSIGQELKEVVSGMKSWHA